MWLSFQDLSIFSPSPEIQVRLSFSEKFSSSAFVNDAKIDEFSVEFKISGFELDNSDFFTYELSLIILRLELNGNSSVQVDLLQDGAIFHTEVIQQRLNPNKASLMENQHVFKTSTKNFDFINYENSQKFIRLKMKNFVSGKSSIHFIGSIQKHIENSKFGCAENEFNCEIKSQTICILRDSVCDSLPDCGQNEIPNYDELGTFCPHSAFLDDFMRFLIYTLAFIACLLLLFGCIR